MMSMSGAWYMVAIASSGSICSGLSNGADAGRAFGREKPGAQSPHRRRQEPAGPGCAVYLPPLPGTVVMGLDEVAHLREQAFRARYLQQLIVAAYQDIIATLAQQDVLRGETAFLLTGPDGRVDLAAGRRAFLVFGSDAAAGAELAGPRFGADMASLQDEQSLPWWGRGLCRGSCCRPLVAAGLDSRGRVGYKLFFGI
jgi:hypothetical protein